MNKLARSLARGGLWPFGRRGASRFLRFLAGMEPGVGFLQVADGQAQVSLGRGERAMPQEVLHMAQIGVVFDQVGGTGMTPDMGGDVLLDPGKAGVVFDQIAHRMAVQGVAPERQEKPVGVALAQQLGPDSLDVGFQEPAGHLAQRRHPRRGQTRMALT